MTEPATRQAPATVPHESLRATLMSVLRSWWERLRNDPGGRAGLRRCQSVTQVYFEPAFHRLLHDLREVGLLEDPGPRLSHDKIAVAAAALSHVKETSEERGFGQALGRLSGDKAKVSDLRFRALLREDAPDDVLRAVIRTVRLLDESVPAAALGADLILWGDAVRKQWAFAYYFAAVPSKP